MSLLFVLPPTKFVMKALSAEYCDLSCYLHRPADFSAERLRRTYSVVPGGFCYARGGARDGDLPPDFSTTSNLVESVFRAGDGSEKAFYRRADS
ncbi:hypothetical protein, partial [Pseudomonas aeruginosa]|uniref:hypothetical protein n=1 Tax=Pseudomonas aeruginosa TaxID=287 RepID=UPI003747E79E